MIRVIEAMQKVGTEPVDAAVQSATIWNWNIQTIAQEASDFTRESWDSYQGLLGKVMGAKSLDKVIEAQTEFAKHSFDRFIAQTTKIGEYCTNF